MTPNAIRLRELRAERRAEWFSTRPCEDCGGRDELQLHHLDPALKEDNNVWLWAKARREGELAKCISLCRDCHLRRHGRTPGGSQPPSVRSRRERAVHGTIAMYNMHQCRCDECRTANREYMRAYRQRRALEFSRTRALPGRPEAARR